MGLKAEYTILPFPFYPPNNPVDKWRREATQWQSGNLILDFPDLSSNTIMRHDPLSFVLTTPRGHTSKLDSCEAGTPRLDSHTNHHCTKPLCSWAAGKHRNPSHKGPVCPCPAHTLTKLRGSIIHAGYSASSSEPSAVHKVRGITEAELG